MLCCFRPKATEEHRSIGEQPGPAPAEHPNDAPSQTPPPTKLEEKPLQSPFALQDDPAHSGAGVAALGLLTLLPLLSSVSGGWWVRLQQACVLTQEHLSAAHASLFVFDANGRAVLAACSGALPKALGSLASWAGPQCPTHALLDSRSSGPGTCGTAGAGGTGKQQQNGACSGTIPPGGMGSNTLCNLITGPAAAMAQAVHLGVSSSDCVDPGWTVSAGWLLLKLRDSPANALIVCENVRGPSSTAGLDAHGSGAGTARTGAQEAAHTGRNGREGAERTSKGGLAAVVAGRSLKSVGSGSWREGGASSIILSGSMLRAVSPATTTAAGSATTATTATTTTTSGAALTSSSTMPRAGSGPHKQSGALPPSRLAQSSSAKVLSSTALRDKPSGRLSVGGYEAPAGQAAGCTSPSGGAAPGAGVVGGGAGGAGWEVQELPGDWQELWSCNGCRHFAAVAVRVAGEVVGVLSLAATGPARPASWTPDALHSVAAMLSTPASPPQVCLASAAIAELRASENLSEVVRVTNQVVGELLLTVTKVETSPRLAFLAVDAQTAAIFAHVPSMCGAEGAAGLQLYADAPPAASGRASGMRRRRRSSDVVLMLPAAPSTGAMPAPNSFADGAAPGAGALAGAVPSGGAESGTSSGPGAGAGGSSLATTVVGGGGGGGGGAGPPGAMHAASFYRVGANELRAVDAGGVASAVMDGSEADDPGYWQNFTRPTGGRRYSLTQSKLKGMGSHGHSLLLSGTLLAEALDRGAAGLIIENCNDYIADAKAYPRDLVLSRNTLPPQSLALVTRGHEGRPLLALYATYATVLPQGVLQSVVEELSQLLEALTPVLAAKLLHGDLCAEFMFLRDQLQEAARKRNRNPDISPQPSSDGHRHGPPSATPRPPQQQQQQSPQQGQGPQGPAPASHALDVPHPPAAAAAGAAGAAGAGATEGRGGSPGHKPPVPPDGAWAAAVAEWAPTAHPDASPFAPPAHPTDTAAVAAAAGLPADLLAAAAAQHPPAGALARRPRTAGQIDDSLFAAPLAAEPATRVARAQLGAPGADAVAGVGLGLLDTALTDAGVVVDGEGEGHGGPGLMSAVLSEAGVPRVRRGAVDPSFTLSAVRTPRGASKLLPVISSIHDRLKAAQALQLTGGRASQRTEELSSVKLLRVLGKGGYGTVYAGTYHNAEVAVKVIHEVKLASDSNNTHITLSKQQLHDAIELVASSSFNHPNCVQVLAHFTDCRLERARPASTDTFGADMLGPLGPAGGGPDAEGVVLRGGVPTAGRAAGGGCEDMRLVHMPSLLDEAADEVSSPVASRLLEPACTVLVLEYCDKGTLHEALTQRIFFRRLAADQVPGSMAVDAHGQPSTKTFFKLDIRAVYATLLEVALALRHMHSLHVVHCDLKPLNILLKSNPRDPRGFTAKLSDFGLSKVMAQDGQGRMVIDDAVGSGTITHMAPEVLLGRIATSAVDIYAFGILMAQMLCGPVVYPRTMTAKDVYDGVIRMGLRPSFPAWVPESYRNLAHRCWHVYPASRPSAGELVQGIEAALNGKPVVPPRSASSTATRFVDSTAAPQLRQGQGQQQGPGQQQGQGQQ